MTPDEYREAARLLQPHATKCECFHVGTDDLIIAASGIPFVSPGFTAVFYTLQEVKDFLAYHYKRDGANEQ